MAVDRTKEGQQDRTRINMNDDRDIDYWTRELNISREQLEAIVKLVGNSVSAVRAELATE